MQVDLSEYKNKWYQPGSPVKRLAWYFINSIFFKTGIFPFYTLKTFWLSVFGAKLGKGIKIKPCVNIKYPWFLEIGDHCWIGEQVWIDNLGKVSIGKNVCLSQGAMLLSGNHDYSKPAFDLMVSPIFIEDGVWVGARSVVCGGAVCGSHAVIAVGSVVTGKLDAYGVYKGNPAALVKQRIIRDDQHR